MQFIGQSWKGWLLAIVLVVLAHISLAAMVMVPWGAPAKAPPVSPPLTLKVAMLATSQADHSQQQVQQQQVAPKPPTKPVVKKAKVAEKYVKKPEPKPKPKPKPEPEPELKPTPKPEVTPKPTPAPPQKQLSHIEAKQAKVTQAQKQGAGKRQAELKQIWYTKINRLLEQRKHYPYLARRRGVEGEVQVGFVLNRQGKLLKVTLVDSSGHDLLDQEAMTIPSRVSTFPPPPPELPGKTFRLVVPFSFTITY